MTRRRAKGDGSVYRREDGRWVGEYDDLNGKRRYITGKTKSGVQAKLRKAIADKEAGIAAHSEHLTVGAYMDRWLDAVKDTVCPGTFRPYEAIVRLHIKPTLGKTKLDRLDALQLQSLYKAKLSSGLSPRRVQYVHATISKALNDAVRWQLLRNNVAEAVKPPRPVKRDIDLLTPEQVRILLRTAQRTQPKLYALYALAGTTGARQGELLALQHGDVDLDTGTIGINRSVYNGVVSDPKTASSRRTIRLSKLALDALRDHLDAYAGDVWIFATSKDTPISCHNLHNRSWKPLLRAAGLPQKTSFTT
jgi:integrase